jgi:hypothetical protein
VYAVYTSHLLYGASNDGVEWGEVGCHLGFIIK